MGRGIVLKDIQQHDVDHRLHQDVGSLRADVTQPLHEASIITVLHDTELQVEEIGEANEVATETLHRLD